MKMHIGRVRGVAAIAVGILTVLSCVPVEVQILEFKFNETGTSSLSTGSSDAVVSFLDLSEEEADLHSAAGQGVAGDITGHPDFGTDRSFDNTASLVMQGLGGIALNPTDESVSVLKSWTVSGWYKTDGTQIFGNGGTVIFQSPTCFVCTPGVGNSGFAVRGEWGNGFRTTVNGVNTGIGIAGNQWLDANTWVFFAVTYDGTEDITNLNYYRGYRNETEAAAHPVEVTKTAFDTFPHGETLPSPGISIGNRTDDMSRAFDGFLDNIRVFGSRVDGGGALVPAQIEAVRAWDLVLTHVAGDYNSDGNVDVGDYEVWRASYGLTDFAYADGNADGIVDAADYTFWRDIMVDAGAGSVLAVPEPGAICLAFMAVGPGGSMFRCRRFAFRM